MYSIKLILSLLENFLRVNGYRDQVGTLRPPVLSRKFLDWEDSCSLRINFHAAALPRDRLSLLSFDRHGQSHQHSSRKLNNFMNTKYSSKIHSLLRSYLPSLENHIQLVIQSNNLLLLKTYAVCIEKKEKLQ